MFDKLANGIPLHEAAAFFIQLRNFEKTAEEGNVGSSSYEPPDQTGRLEGQFEAPVEVVLQQMAKMVQNELKTNFAYMVYSNSLRDLSHPGIAEEFEDHATNETEHADWLLRRMSVLGGPVQIPDIPSPPPSSDPHDIIQRMIRIEQEGINNWRILRKLVGDENPMKFKIEEYLTREQEHLDELWQLLPHQANPEVLLRQQAGGMSSVEVPTPPPSAPDTSPAPPEGLGKTAGDLSERAPYIGAALGGTGLSAAGLHYAMQGKNLPAAALLATGVPLSLGGAFMSTLHPKLRQKIEEEVHDPRLYSNLRGALSLENAKERVKAHRLLDRDKEHSIFSAAREGFTRGGHKEKKAADLTTAGRPDTSPAPPEGLGKTAVSREWVHGAVSKAKETASPEKLEAFASRMKNLKGRQFYSGKGGSRLAENAGLAAYIAKSAADLTTAGREHIAKKNFALSAKQSDTGKPAYPIHDKAHAANALARVKQHGTPAEKAEVYKDVARKFPELAARSSVPSVQKKAKEKNSEFHFTPLKPGFLREIHDKNGAIYNSKTKTNPLVKEKNSQMPGGLPPAGMGQHSMAAAPMPLSGPAAGDTGMKMAMAFLKMAKEERSPEEVGKERARASLSAEFEKEKAHKHERNMDMAGRIVGGASGGAAMHRYGKGNALATLGGIALGQHLGGKALGHLGYQKDMKEHEKTAEEGQKGVFITPEIAEKMRQGAILREKHRARTNLGTLGGVMGGAALAGLGSRAAGLGHVSTAILGSAGGLAGGGIGAGLASHYARKAMTPEELALAQYRPEVTSLPKVASHFKLALESLSAIGGAPSLAESSGEAVESPEEQMPMQDPAVMQYLQQEQAGMAAEKEQESNFYRQKFQEASQQLQAANQQVQQLQQQADSTGQQQQQAMQQAQQIQQAAMQNAQAAHQAATQAMQQSLASQQQEMQQAQLAVGMRDAVHAMRQGLMQMVQQQLPPATPAEAGTAPQGAPPAPGGMPGMDNSQQAPNAEQAASNQAGQPQAQPDAGTPMQSATPGDGSGPGANPNMGQGAEPTMQGAQPQGEQGMAQQPQKVASSHDKLIGAIVGGLAGGGLAAYGSGSRASSSNEALRQKIQGMEEADRGGGGFMNAMNLAQAKARLAVGEFEERHPVASTAIGAGLGASSLSQAAPHLRRAGSDIRKVIGG